MSICALFGQIMWDFELKIGNSEQLSYIFRIRLLADFTQSFKKGNKLASCFFICVLVVARLLQKLKINVLLFFRVYVIVKPALVCVYYTNMIHGTIFPFFPAHNACMSYLFSIISSNFRTRIVQRKNIVVIALHLPPTNFMNWNEPLRNLIIPTSIPGRSLLWKSICPRFACR